MEMALWRFGKNGRLIGRRSIVKRNNTEGMTMVEVVVAFAVLVLTLGIFSRSLIAAGKTLNRVNAVWDHFQELTAAYYLDEEENLRLKLRRDIMLEFTQRDRSESFSVRVQMRQFSHNGKGKLFDVIPENGGQDGQANDGQE